MEEKKQIGPRVHLETIKKLNELVEYFESSNPFGRVSKDAVVEIAIKELHEKYIQ